MPNANANANETAYGNANRPSSECRCCLSKRKIKMTFEHRGYEIERDETTGKYSAKGDDDFELVSFDKSRITKAIDQLWSALNHIDAETLKLFDTDTLPLPGWIRSWLRSDNQRVDIDRAFATGQL